MTAQHNINIMLQHVPGISNIIPDLLSRLQVDRFRAQLPSADPDPTPISNLERQSTRFSHCLNRTSYKTNLGTGQNLSGTRAGTIDRGAKTFFRKEIGGGDFFSKKIRGRRLFFRKKLGGEDFFRKKSGGRRLFLPPNLKTKDFIF